METPGPSPEEINSTQLLPEAKGQLALITPESIRPKEVGTFDIEDALEKIRNSEGQEVLAVDMGGNKLAKQKFVVKNGEVVSKGDLTINLSNKGAGYLGNLIEVCEEKIEEDLPVGLSVAGPLDGTSLHMGPNVQAFADEFEELYGSDFANLFGEDGLAVDNDAVAGLKAGALAAYKKNGTKDVLYIISGSGFGAALLRDGKLYALEPGHIPASEDLNLHGAAKPCGVFGNEKPCIEQVASGRAGIESLYLQITGQKKNGLEISEAAKNGDKVAQELYNNAARGIATTTKGLIESLGLMKNGGKDFTVVMHGGVFNATGVRDLVGQYLERDVDGALNTMYTADISENACLEGAAISAIMTQPDKKNPVEDYLVPNNPMIRV